MPARQRCRQTPGCHGCIADYLHASSMHGWQADDPAPGLTSAHATPNCACGLEGCIALTCTKLKHFQTLCQLRVSRQVAAERNGGRPCVEPNQVGSGGRWGTFYAAAGFRRLLAGAIVFIFPVSNLPGERSASLFFRGRPAGERDGQRLTLAATKLKSSLPHCCM